MPRAYDATQLQYGNFYLPSRYSNLLLPNFFYNSFLQPGVTYTDRYQMGTAGQIFVPKLKPSTVELKEPCSTFDHKDIGNELLQITLNCTYMSSKKICALQETVADYALISETVRLSARELAESWNMSGIAALLHEGSGQSVRLNRPRNLDELKNDILSARTTLYKNKFAFYYSAVEQGKKRPFQLMHEFKITKPTFYHYIHELKQNGALSASRF